MPPPICHYLKSWPPDDSNPMRSISPAVPAAPPPGPQLQPPLTLDPTPREPAHSDLLDAASSSSSSSCPPCSPEPGREAPGPEPAVAAVGNGVNGEGRSEKGRLYCPTCKVTVNSASQLQAHNTGQCRAPLPPPPPSPPPPQVQGGVGQGDPLHSCRQAGVSGHFAQGLHDRGVVSSCDWVGIWGPPTNA